MLGLVLERESPSSPRKSVALSMGLSKTSGSSVKLPCMGDVRAVEVENTLDGAVDCLEGVYDVLEPVRSGRRGVTGP